MKKQQNIRMFEDKYKAQFPLLFLYGCKTGNTPLVDTILYTHSWIDVHAQNERAFYIACANGHTEIVKRLLSLTGHQKTLMQITILNFILHVQTDIRRL